MSHELKLAMTCNGLGIWDVQYPSRGKGPEFSGVMEILNLKKK
jgi:hypothetical protein